MRKGIARSIDLLSQLFARKISASSLVLEAKLALLVPFPACGIGSKELPQDPEHVLPVCGALK